MEWVHGWRAMGVDCKVVCPVTLDAQWFEDATAAYEQTFSRFRADSALRVLSRRGHGNVNADLQQLLLASLDIAYWTTGMVVPHLGAALEAIGYDRTYATIVPNSSPIDVPHIPDWRHISVRGQAVSLPPGTQLDLNGVAKGWIAQRLAERTAQPRVLVEIGGEVAVIAPADDPWCVAIDHPTAAEPLALLRLAVGTVATSSTRQRRWLRAGSVVHHIIDPRTALPAATDVVTASVIAHDGVYAEAAAKVCVLLGATRGAAWLTDRQLPGLIYTEDQHVLTTPFLDAFLWEYDR